MFRLYKTLTVCCLLICDPVKKLNYTPPKFTSSMSPPSLLSNFLVLFDPPFIVPIQAQPHPPQKIVFVYKYA